MIVMVCVIDRVASTCREAFCNQLFKFTVSINPVTYKFGYCG
jgi:hypothetical protein